MSDSNNTLGLNKKLYGAKNVQNTLDLDFKEFTINPSTVKEFFKLYNEYFYSLSGGPNDQSPNTTHMYIFSKSRDYAFPNYENPRSIEIKELNKTNEDLQIQIESVEREHPYYKNGKNINNRSFSPNEAIRTYNMYYMQSAKKRKIENVEIYSKLKNRVTLRSIDIVSDQDFMISVDNNGLNSIPNGPPLINDEDVFASPYDINIYNG